jgi:hypothetical protein
MAQGRSDFSAGSNMDPPTLPSAAFSGVKRQISTAITAMETKTDGTRPVRNGQQHNND